MSNSNRRTGPRLPADQIVQVTLIGPNEINVIGQAVDVSPGGMRLLVGCPLEVGASLHIDLGSTSLMGEIRYCEPSGSGFAIGLRTEHGVRDLSDLARMIKAVPA